MEKAIHSSVGYETQELGMESVCWELVYTAYEGQPLKFQEFGELVSTLSHY